jgi:hypothetical protein
MLEATLARIRGISQILGADDAEGADGGQRSAFSAIQFVGSFTYANQLAIVAARQIKPACGNVSQIARLFIPLARVMSRTAADVAVGPAITLARIVNVTWIPHGSSFYKRVAVGRGHCGADRTIRGRVVWSDPTPGLLDAIAFEQSLR